MSIGIGATLGAYEITALLALAALNHPRHRRHS